MVTHTCKPVIRRLRPEDQEFKASLGKAAFKDNRAIQRGRKEEKNIMGSQREKRRREEEQEEEEAVVTLANVAVDLSNTFLVLLTFANLNKYCYHTQPTYFFKAHMKFVWGMEYVCVLYVHECETMHKKAQRRHRVSSSITVDLIVLRQYPSLNRKLTVLASKFLGPT